MMRWIIQTCLTSRHLVVAIAVAMMFFGITQLRAMPVDAFPEFAQPHVEVQTEAIGLSAQEVEQLITVPMEQDLLNGVAWLQSIHSESIPGLSSITLIFEPGTDLIRARQMVAERLTQAHALPHVSKPPMMLQPTSSTNRVMIVGLSSKTLSLIDMSVLARWTIGPRLMGVPGVANLAIWGQRDRQLQVQVDPKRLQANGISLLQVLETTGNALWVSSLSFLEASTPGTGGFIDTPNQRLGIRHISPIASADSLAQVPIEDSSLRLGDVTNVIEDHQPLIGDAIVKNGQGLLLVIEKFPGTNTLDVTRGVEAALAAMRPGLPGLELDSSVYRPASFIEMAISNLTSALLLGGMLLLLVLGLFLFDWRTALISLLAIPLSLVAGAVVLYQQGVGINTIVLAGFVVAIGVLVDDAIVDVEHVARRLREHRLEGSDKSAATIILESALEVRGALAYATLIGVLMLVPVLYIGDLSGAFFMPLVLSYTLAVLASTVVALTVTPALCLILLDRAPAEGRVSPLAAWAQRGYERVLAPILHGPRRALASLAALLIVGMVVTPLLSTALLPAFKERDLLVHFTSGPGTSGSEMARIVGRASRELEAIPGVINVGAHIGRAIMSDQVVDVNSSELWVSIDPAAGYAATVAAIQRVAHGYPGIQGSVKTYLQERSSEVLPVSDSGIVVRIFGTDLNVLERKANEVKQALAGIDGISATRVKLPLEQPALDVVVDMAKAQKYGIKPGDVRRAAATLVSGIQVGNLFEEQKVFDVVVWGAPETRGSLSNIQDLLIDTPSGAVVRLGDVAQVRIIATPSVIRHASVERYLDISADVRGRMLGAVAVDVEQRLRSMALPLEYHAEVLGGYAERQAAQTRLLGFVIAALIGIFLLLQAAFSSWRLALLSFITFPASLAGGLVAVLLTGGVLSLGSLIGFLTIFVIAVRNGMLLIKHYQYLELHEGEELGVGLIVRGARERLTPILMTAFATGLALLPLVIAGDIPGSEILRPMAIVILGGLVTATLLNLFIVPALYLQFGPSPVADTAKVQYPATSPAAG